MAWRGWFQRVTTARGVVWCGVGYGRFRSRSTNPRPRSNQANTTSRQLSADQHEPRKTGRCRGQHTRGVGGDNRSCWRYSNRTDHHDCNKQHQTMLNTCTLVLIMTSRDSSSSPKHCLKAETSLKAHEAVGVACVHVSCEKYTPSSAMASRLMPQFRWMAPRKRCVFRVRFFFFQEKQPGVVNEQTRRYVVGGA